MGLAFPSFCQPHLNGNLSSHSQQQAEPHDQFFSPKAEKFSCPLCVDLINRLGWATLSSQNNLRSLGGCNGCFPNPAAGSTRAEELTYRIVLIHSDKGSRDTSHKETRALTGTVDDLQQLHLVCRQFMLHFRWLCVFLGFFSLLSYPRNYAHCSSCCVYSSLKNCSLSNPWWPAKAPKQAARINPSPDKIFLNPNR